MLYNVALPLDINPPFFTYHHDDSKLQIGQIVIINLKNKEYIGVIIGNNNSQYENSERIIKQILSILPYSIPKNYIDFAEFVAKYTMNSLGKILKLIIPFSVEDLLAGEKNIKSISAEKENIQLSNDQFEAITAIEPYDKFFKTILLHGVTGSGKTEVFLEFIREKEQVLIVVPEIALSSELAKKVASRLDKDIPVYIWHYSISRTKKREIWKKAINGEKMVIVGARSSIFIPFLKIQCIVFDEEHDRSFKQSEGIRYNARDMAIYLSKLINIPIILSSATPSLETYYNAVVLNKYLYIKLNSKYFKENTKPEIYIDDLRKQKYTGILSKYSINAIKKCLDNEKQALVFINRRGHTPRLICSKCGWKANCPNCDTWLCYHDNDKSLKCHYCGFVTKSSIKNCKGCGEKETLIGIGTGIEKASEQISKIFNNARIISLSSDNMNTPAKIANAINLIQNHQVDIIVGTQILVKGHNFMNLNTVIITCGDLMLYGEDFRTAEKAFQTIFQISGRAGRSLQSNGSNIIFQTFNPQDKLIKLLLSQNSQLFYEKELANRKLVGMPPFGKIASITLISKFNEKLKQFANILLKNSIEEKNVKVIGPIIPSIAKIRNMYRLHFIIISHALLQNYIKKFVFSTKPDKDVKILIDIDPYDFT